METVKVQWHSRQGQWQVTLANGQYYSIEQWAEQIPDLTQVRMILSANNYAVHWLSLVGVSQRHLAKVLPFALEESLIEDVHDYLIVPAGAVQKRFRAFVVAKELVANLLATCDLHHIRVNELIPETSLLDQQDGAVCVRVEHGWNLRWPAVFEGYVADATLTPVLDAIFADEQQIEKITVQAHSLDQINLFKTLLETAYHGQIGQVESQLLAEDDGGFKMASKPVNLLTGKFQQRVAKEEKPAVWWKALAGLAAVWLLLWTVGLYSDVHRLKSQAFEVNGQSIALYKQLFPGERIRSLERQFKEKLSGESTGTTEGFLNSTHTLAQVYAQQKMAEKVSLLSIRYNDRMAETTVEVKAKSLNELQALRQALENAGLTAEIASATNDKDGVKGRLRITG